MFISFLYSGLHKNYFDLSGFSRLQDININKKLCYSEFYTCFSTFYDKQVFFFVKPQMLFIKAPQKLVLSKEDVLLQFLLIHGVV